MSKNLLSIIIPTYNEEKTISSVLDKVPELDLIGDFKKEIIIANDCSKGQTVAAIEQFGSVNPDIILRLFHQPVNMGKGAAIHLVIA